MKKEKSRKLRFTALVLLLLTVMTRPCSSTVEERQGNDNNDRLETEEPSMIVQENGIFVLSPEMMTSAPAYDRLLQQAIPSASSNRSLVYVMIHDPNCPQSHKMLKDFELANQLMKAHSEEEALVFGKLVVSGKAYNSYLTEYEVDALPTLFFLAKSDQNDVLVLICSGLRDNALEIFRTGLHYYVRIVLVTGGIQVSEDVVQANPPQFSSFQDVQSFLEKHRQSIVSLDLEDGGMLPLTSVVPPVPLDLNGEQANFATWLFREKQLVFEAVVDDLVLIVQCRLFKKQDVLYDVFDDFSRTLSNRRDVFFAVATGEPCRQAVEDGGVGIWKVPTDFDFADWTLIPHAVFKPNNDQHLKQTLTRLCTPSILWLDRQASAPIAFPEYRQVHAVIFVDLHNLSDEQAKLRTKQVVTDFRQVCKLHRRRFAIDGNFDDLVCLVVPSIDARVLNTFGIDIWSPLDQQLSWKNATSTDILPILMVTDRRFGGTKRFYLDKEDILEANDSISRFMTSFWDGKLKPETKSDPRGCRTNSAGVRIVTANSMVEELTKDPTKHKLIVFTSPTCGHCKRFLSMWNRLSEFLRHIGWHQSFLSLYRMDVTTNEAPLVTVRWVPDLYYIPPGVSDVPKLIRYDIQDELGDGAGAMKSFMDVLRWFLSTAKFEDENRLAELLTGLRTNF